MFKSSFTKVVQDSNRLFKAEIECHNDVICWHSPSECHDDVRRSFAKQWQKFWEGHNWEPQEFVDEFERRGISYKYLYFNMPWVLEVCEN